MWAFECVWSDWAKNRGEGKQQQKLALRARIPAQRRAGVYDSAALALRYVTSGARTSRSVDICFRSVGRSDQSISRPFELGAVPASTDRAADAAASA